MQQTKKDSALTGNTVIVGGGIAGLVTALTLLEKGQQVIIVDRDTKERLGGLARWAFGGMALCNTAEQKRMKIPDDQNLLLKDWHSFANFSEQDIWPRAWAKEYAENNYNKVYCWVKKLGLSFLPAVNWVERGLHVPGNTVPRYHVLWGTGWQLIEKIIDKLAPYLENNQLVIYHQHKVNSVLMKNEQAYGVSLVDEKSVDKDVFELHADNVVIACGGINGSTERVKQNWYKPWGKPPTSLLNGANPISDGKLHDEIVSKGGVVTHSDKMWNYAAGIKHPQAEFDGHGLSLIPCKSALWLDHTGKRIGPMPLITGFDTNYLCQQVAKQEEPWTWQVLNWRIAAKELAVSGSMHNPSIRDKKLFIFLKEILLGNHSLVTQLIDESEDVLCANTVEELVVKMNQCTDQDYLDSRQLEQEIKEYDQRLKIGEALQNDEQVRRINHARQWRPDKLRTCKPQAILSESASLKKGDKLIAIKLQLISRKSLGGVQTNLQSQVLDTKQQAITGLYCVGEAAGFGGGGASGFRSLEGTFLSGCILTAQNAAEAILKSDKEKG
jgi:predicted oxidoreductase